MLPAQFREGQAKTIAAGEDGISRGSAMLAAQQKSQLEARMGLDVNNKISLENEKSTLRANSYSTLAENTEHQSHQPYESTLFDKSRPGTRQIPTHNIRKPSSSMHLTQAASQTS